MISVIFVDTLRDWQIEPWLNYIVIISQNSLRCTFIKSSTKFKFQFIPLFVCIKLHFCTQCTCWYIPSIVYVIYMYRIRICMCLYMSTMRARRSIYSKPRWSCIFHPLKHRFPWKSQQGAAFTKLEFVWNSVRNRQIRAYYTLGIAHSYCRRCMNSRLINSRE